ncbi:MAG: tRNA (adenosine(37)-N6)-threonylcarbamoyltransferase complex transferase subunit TsaD [Candidatus Bipolaricaulota bacterium]|nr:tRNA (adenosine(37)-N6)-threonylcarbamoyltransferase complex transferase subunit TsaD [Candidatus Bipolaricaulota bacterium]MDW8126704.1 tRNA (adenosine(37)-N6)-threonylcarbamoyltransferase complex transferase subunit TsaD [Candidatus Bipolaricaulota bacterium]
MVVLGIETSCDETGVALVRDGQEILTNLVYSQTDLHARYGGVMPEAASRDHLRKLPALVTEALQKAGIPWNEVDLVGVTYGPGLIGPLLVGVSYAAGVALALDVPLVGVNHLAAHLFALKLADPPVDPPFLGLIASGGHTLLVAVPAWGEYRVVGGTRDDAAGEALDKFGRLLGLPYPAGPKIDALAKEGDPQAIPFPRPMLESGLDMSFAGLKTAAIYWLRDHPGAPLPDLCASFLEAVIEVLVEKALRAARRFQFKRIAVAGGVAANRRLREVFPARAATRGVEVFFPPRELCTDNAAIVAACAHHRYAVLNISDPLSLSPDANLPLHGWR